MGQAGTRGPGRARRGALGQQSKQGGPGQKRAPVTPRGSLASVGLPTAPGYGLYGPRAEALGAYGRRRADGPDRARISGSGRPPTTTLLRLIGCMHRPGARRRGRSSAAGRACSDRTTMDGHRGDPSTRLSLSLSL